MQGVFSILKDQQWHCRECGYGELNVAQIAGGGGIRGLERGTGSRPGIEIERANHFCGNCGRTTRQDRWAGQFVSPVQGAGMQPSFARRASGSLGHRDVIEGTERPINQLALDRKLPMLGWDEETKQAQARCSNLPGNGIRGNFQLLKRPNGSVSHNSLKRRACESCSTRGKRGTPLGIRFFYEGDGKWQGNSKKDKDGRIGCGWFDFDKWRRFLNQKLWLDIHKGT